MSTWQQGQTVLRIPSFNESRRGSREPVTTTIEKVGRKYFYLAGETTRFRLSDGREDTEYTGSARYVTTLERHARMLRQEAANRRLRELGLNSVGSWLPFTVEQLEAVIVLLEGHAVLLTSEEAHLTADFVRDRIDTGWADPEWPTDDDLRALAKKLDPAS